MGFFSVDNELVQQAEQINKEEAASFAVTSGLKDVKINVAYITESDSSEAKGLTIMYNDGKSKYDTYETFWFQGADGKTTRMAKKSDGTEYPDLTFGMKQVRALCDVLGLDPDKLSPQPGKIETKDGTKEVMVFPEFTGEVFTAGIQATMEDKYGNESEFRTVPKLIWIGRSQTDEDGYQFPWSRKKPYKWFLDVIAKEPVKDDRKQSKPGATPATSTQGSEAAAAFGAFGS